jgi:hypothetical protein
MKVFLRSTQNGWYYKGPSKWTPEPQAAQDLGQTARAVALIFEAHLENVEILLSYDNPRYDLVLPVPPSTLREHPLRRRQTTGDSLTGEKTGSVDRGKKQLRS